jgi:hypothetical protein
MPSASRKQRLLLGLLNWKRFQSDPNHERTLAWLDRAFAQRDGGLSMTKGDPMLRLLHADPRWRPFLQKLGTES